MLLEDVVAMEEWERTHITWGDWARFALLIATIVFLIIAMCAPKRRRYDKQIQNKLWYAYYDWSEV